MLQTQQGVLEIVCTRPDDMTTVVNTRMQQPRWHNAVFSCAGFWTLQNFVRPLRFSLAIALAPVFERFLNTISRATGLSKPRAFGVYLFILGTVTSTLVFGSIFVFCGPLAYAR